MSLFQLLKYFEILLKSGNNGKLYFPEPSEADFSGLFNPDGATLGLDIF